MSAGEIVVYSIRGLIVLLFVIFGIREIALLFLRPARNMGTGLGRLWAVARTTMLEAWAGRIWMLPLLWLVSALLLIMAVRPSDESERIPLYIKALLSSQEALLLVMMWVMACLSLPRERERKILVTNASKPLSRLEIVLGKITGFAAVAALCLLTMGLASLAILEVSDLRLRGHAQDAYDLQVHDFNKTFVTPSEGLKQLADQGSLYAYNYITVPRDGGLNLGFLQISQDKDQAPIRGLIGGTQEKIIYRFGPRLEEPDAVSALPAGTRPYFEFFFPIKLVGDAVPAKVKIRISAYAEGPANVQEKELTLDSRGMAAWEPDRPDELYSTFDPKSMYLIHDRGMVTVEVRCPTPGVVLQVFDGADPDSKMQLPPGAETNVDFANMYSRYIPGAAQSVNFPSVKPVIRGSERRDRQEIQGPKPDQPLNELAIYRFSGATLRNVPVDDTGHFNLTLNLETYKVDHPELPTYVVARVFSVDRTGAPPFEQRMQVSEKRMMTISVPAANLGDKDPARRGDMVVMLYCDSPGHSVSVIEDSVRIELARTPFALNFFKSEAIIFLEALLLITLAVVCSVRLGWPVAMLLSGAVFLFGMSVTWIAGLKEYGGLGALNYHDYSHPTALFNFFDSAANTLWTVLGFISILAPNFEIYQPQEFIGNLQNTPWNILGANAVNTLIYIVPLVALAHLIFRKQELG